MEHWGTSQTSFGGALGKGAISGDLAPWPMVDRPEFRRLVPQVTAVLNTIRIWQRCLDAGQLEWPLEERGVGEPPWLVVVEGDTFDI
eukprot:44680-Amphidinium_carterae.2